MTFLLDHCVWNETQIVLEKAGFACLTLRQIGDIEASNGALLALARQCKAILVTRDRGFGRLAIYPPGRHYGIILLCIRPETIDAVHAVMLKALATLSFEQCHKNVLIITSASYRIHKAI